MGSRARAGVIPAAMAVALAVAAVATGCGLGPTDVGDEHRAEVTPAERRADTEVRTLIKHAATVMESSLIDLGHYPGARGDLFTDELLPSDGVVVEALTLEPDRQSYCLRGSSGDGSRSGADGNGEYWWFASGDLRIRPQPRDACVGPGEFWVVAD